MYRNAEENSNDHDKQTKSLKKAAKRHETHVNLDQNWVVKIIMTISNITYTIYAHIYTEQKFTSNMGDY